MGEAAEKRANGATPAIDFRTEPARYRHWKLAADGDTATLTMDVDAAFHGWSGAWLDPGFAKFDTTDALAYIRVPVLVLQGAADPYGTLAQLRVLEEQCYCPVEAVVLDGVGHAPQREDPAVTLSKIADFACRIFSEGVEDAA